MKDMELSYAIGHIEAAYHEHMACVCQMRVDPHCSPEDLADEQHKAESCKKALDIITNN